MEPASAATKVIAPGPLTFVANFDEALKVFIRGRGGLRTPTAADISLVNNTTGTSVFPALAVDSNPAMTQFMADFAALPEGNYTLTLTSGDDAFEDPVGNDLDGEPLGLNPDGTISGDGVNGGDYVLNFFVDDSVPAESIHARQSAWKLDQRQREQPRHLAWRHRPGRLQHLPGSGHSADGPIGGRSRA